MRIVEWTVQDELLHEEADKVQPLPEVWLMR